MSYILCVMSDLEGMHYCKFGTVNVSPRMLQKFGVEAFEEIFGMSHSGESDSNETVVMLPSGALYIVFRSVGYPVMAPSYTEIALKKCSIPVKKLHSMLFDKIREFEAHIPDADLRDVLDI